MCKYYKLIHDEIYYSKLILEDDIKGVTIEENIINHKEVETTKINEKYRIK